MGWDSAWDEVFRNSEWGKYPGEDLIRFVARNFYRAVDRRDVRILEIGCGPGANLWYIAREGFTVEGIDGSSTAVHKAKARLDQEVPNWNGEIRIGDILELPYVDNLFDAVIDNQAISCNSFESAQRMYRETHRVLKPGGKFYSRTFADGSWGDQTGTSVGHHAWIVSEGPLLDKGFSRFTTKEEIPDLTNPLHIDEVELLSRTVNNGANTIKEWIIIGHK
ncbi:class I SAM-dependent methyltransferase [Cohnella pontilimi]|uniref:Class I SAM-dependent methyltransferase n=1 Tax=Cohnella pontilimi TaxID=2564100 RepID=A0A4U0FB14_9BACL|nr:class I SAM-dependent methyltransferase [Cohnella pontilimi]TJY41965.1 class I SAM-dependent methyltransferase [Cohnella pontilimi]